MNRCSYIKTDGYQCEAYAMQNSKLCFTHNPDVAEEKIESAIKGGKAPRKSSLKLPERRIQDTKDVVLLLEETINLVRGGKMDIRVANCLGYLGSHIIRAIEISDLEQKIEKLEDRIE